MVTSARVHAELGRARAHFVNLLPLVPAARTHLSAKAALQYLGLYEYGQKIHIFHEINILFSFAAVDAAVFCFFFLFHFMVGRHTYSGQTPTPLPLTFRSFNNSPRSVPFVVAVMQLHLIQRELWFPIWSGRHYEAVQGTQAGTSNLGFNLKLFMRFGVELVVLIIMKTRKNKS